MIIGRCEEQLQLDKIYKSKEAEFITIYGRRRVGKTYLIKHFFSQKKGIFFHITGLRKGLKSDQLHAFTRVLETTFYQDGLQLKEPMNWLKAFELLTNAINLQTKNTKVVLFFDELPWLATKKSRFIQALDYYWNRYWVDIPNVKLIVCGSAASFIINNIINDKGGLHDRITGIIVLEPFSLNDTKKYLLFRICSFLKYVYFLC